jgi:transcriptional regulator with XRE-family HTH domain
MTRKYLSVRAWGEEKLKQPAFKSAYDALEDEFANASALVDSRSQADMTQEQVAEAMGTTQTVIARLESGRVMPSTRTLERFARATRTRLRISFEPETGDRGRRLEAGVRPPRRAGGVAADRRPRGCRPRPACQGPS